MNQSLSATIILSLAGLLTLTILVYTVLNRHGSKRARWLVFFLTAVILVGCGSALITILQPNWIPRIWQLHFPTLTVIVALATFVIITRNTLKARTSYWVASLTWLVWAALTLLLDPNLFLINAYLGSYLAENALRFLPGVVKFVGWWAVLAIVAWDMIQAIQQPPNPIIRKRAQLWLPGWVIFTTGTLGLLSGRQTAGLFVTSLAVAFIGVVALSRDLPYPRFLVREILTYVILLVPILALTWLGFFVLQWVDPLIPRISTFVIAGAFTLLLIGSYRFFLVIAPRLVNRLIPATRYDTAQLLREYSQNVSNTTAPGMLASISIKLLCQAVGLDFGHLFEVIPEASPDESVYIIQDAGGVGANEFPPLTVSADSSFAALFRRARQPLFVNQINTNPHLRGASPAENAWFSNPNIEVFVPIITKQEWVGLFALGQKMSGAPYTDDDLTLVNALADQISLALQNARLVESLMRVNNDFRRAYSAMEQSNIQLQGAFRQLEKIDRTKSDFISVSSHELRTPMTVIRGYNEMLIDDNIIKGSPYHFKLVKGIQTGMERMHEVVESMLDVASIDSRSLQLHKENISLNFVVRVVVDGLEGAFEERKIGIKIENLPDLPSIEADRESMLKVFIQIITNAIKYTPDGGKITISARVLAEGSYDFPEGGVEVVVSDTGIGIDRDNLELIFKKFYQTGPINLHSSGKIKFKGAGPGLGLAIAKGIVEAHDGKIWAESGGQDEKTCPGSQFHIALPLRSLQTKN